MVLICYLLYRINNGFEGFRVVHGQISKNLAVNGNPFLVDQAHEFRVGHTILPYCSVDSLYPKGTEFDLLLFTVAVGIG